MLSRVISKTGLTKGSLLSRCQIRTMSTAPAVAATPSSNAATEAAPFGHWEEVNKVFYGPERDMKNWPTPRVPDKTPPLRYFLFPQSWTDAFYEKTGVLGFGFFCFSVGSFLVNKEYIPFDDHAAELMGSVIAYTIIYNKVAPKVRAFYDAEYERRHKYLFTGPIENAKKICSQSVTAQKEVMSFCAGQKELFDIKRENLDLQLEADYRSRIQNVYTSVKRQLDYQVDIVNIRNQYEQNHLVDWVVSNVRKSITPQQEKDSIANCLQTLKKLSSAPATA